MDYVLVILQIFDIASKMSLWIKPPTFNYSKNKKTEQSLITHLQLSPSTDQWMLFWRRFVLWTPCIYSHSILNAFSNFFSSSPVKCQVDVYESGKIYGVLFQNKLEISCDDFIGKRSKKHPSNSIDGCYDGNCVLSCRTWEWRNIKREVTKGGKRWRVEGKWWQKATEWKLCAVVKEETERKYNAYVRCLHLEFNL